MHLPAQVSADEAASDQADTRHSALLHADVGSVAALPCMPALPEPALLALGTPLHVELR